VCNSEDQYRFKQDVMRTMTIVLYSDDHYSNKCYKERTIITRGVIYRKDHTSEKCYIERTFRVRSSFNKDNRNEMSV
jgi:hypothetical protein